MPDYLLTDLERCALVASAIELLSRLSATEGHRPADLLSALAKLEGADTKVTVHRAYPPQAVRQ
jgi:hypothetical protein